MPVFAPIAGRRHCRPSRRGWSGSAPGVAVLGGVLAAMGTTTTSGQPDPAAYHVAFFVVAALMVVGAAADQADHHAGP